MRKVRPKITRQKQKLVVVCTAAIHNVCVTQLVCMLSCGKVDKSKMLCVKSLGFELWWRQERNMSLDEDPCVCVIALCSEQALTAL